MTPRDNNDTVTGEEPVLARAVATPPGFKGTVTADPMVLADLERLAHVWPLGTPIAHRSGRDGVVALDEPPNVPGTFDGQPTAWCWLTSDGDGVCMKWMTGGVPVITWVRATDIRVTSGRRANKPSLRTGR